jgi:hypothetical protein
MAGLSNFLSDTTTKATTLPSWMNTAQQNVVNQATIGAASVPQLQNTVAQGAINQLSSSATNPFTQAQSTLGHIASGAANPWIVDPATGAVSPNTNTALGGLFQAQNQQLQQQIPGITAPVTGAGTASGQFGSLRTQTAADKAIADAQANLFAQQNQAALQNQQTGVQAGTAMGNVGSQYGTTAGALANLQQTSPLAAASNLGKIIGGLTTGSDVTSSTQMSPLSQVASIGSALGGGTNAVNSLLNTVSPGTTIGSLLGGLFSSSGSGMSQDPTNPAGVKPGEYTLADGSTINVTDTGYKTITGKDGTSQTFDPQGNVYTPQSTTDITNSGDFTPTGDNSFSVNPVVEP